MCSISRVADSNYISVTGTEVKSNNILVDKILSSLLVSKKNSSPVQNRYNKGVKNFVSIRKKASLQN